MKVPESFQPIVEQGEALDLFNKIWERQEGVGVVAVFATELEELITSRLFPNPAVNKPASVQPKPNAVSHLRIVK